MTENPERKKLLADTKYLGYIKAVNDCRQIVLAAGELALDNGKNKAALALADAADKCGRLLDGGR